MNEISGKEFLDILKRYKLSIIFLPLVFVIIASVYAYFKPNIYQSDATIEIQNIKSKGKKNDLLIFAAGGDADSIDNVVEILQSRHIISTAMKDLDLNVRYFTKQNYKTIELYKNSPFVVSIAMVTPKALHSRFKIIPESQNSFKLVIKPSLKQKIISKIMNYFHLLKQDDKPINFEKTYHYGEIIDTPWFSLTIQKIFDVPGQEYTFTVSRDKDIIDFIRSKLTVSPVSELGSIVSLRFEDTIPFRTKEILDAISNAYINETLTENTESAKRKLDFIDTQLASIHESLQKSAQKLQKFKAINIITNISEKGTLASSKLSNLETKLYDLNMRLGVLKNILQYISTHKDIKGIDVDASQALSPAISSLILKIQEANQLRTNLLTDYTELHPDVQKVTRQLRSLKASLEEALKSAIFSLEKQKQTLQEIIAKNKKMLQRLPEQERELEKLSRNFMVNEKIYSYLLEKRAETAIAAASTLPRAKIIDTPIVPETPVKPKRLLIIIVSFIFGFIVAIALAFIRNSFNDTIKTSDELEKLTKIPLYGAIPFLSGRKNLSTFHEALRVIRTNLEFLQHTGKSKLVTITSTIPKEGKTTISTELSKIIAKSGKKVIIADLDMRQSKVHKMFNLPNKEGLSTLLAGKNTLKEVIQRTNEDNLYVITSGPKPPDPSELLMSEEFKKLIERLLNEYDYVLLDSPPIGLVTDAMIAMRMSDINLVVLRAEYSKKDFIKNINRFAEEHEIKVGIILNGLKVSANKGAYGYGYGVSYGYSNNYYS